MRWTNPRSIRRRIQYAPLISLTALTVFVPLLGLVNNAAATEAGPPSINWGLGGPLWVIGVFLVPIHWFWVGKVKRAITVYTLLTIALFPAALAILNGALSLSLVMLGADATMVIALGLLLGLGTLPLVVRTRRDQFKAAIKKGYLRRSLSADRATWDGQYDHDEAMSTDWLKRPGCFIRLLPWVGPIIGMRLADVFGRSTANVVMVAAFLFGGYTLVYFGLVKASVQLLEFRRMETELGRPIMLTEERAGD
jgi:hypothetical protein